MKIVREKIFESPDGIEADNLANITRLSKLGFLDKEQGPLAFGYYNGRLLLSDIGGTHVGTKRHYLHINKELNRNDFEKAGRIWIKPRVISFWEYPKSKNELYKILKDIESEFKQRFPDINPIDFSNGWHIEIITQKIPGDFDLKREDDSKDWSDALNAKLIPIEQFKSSDDQSAKARARNHAYSPLEKLKRPKTSNSGYFSIRDKKEKPLAWKQALQTSESLVLNEKLLIGEPLTIEELRDLLHKKVINFEFIKLDGEVRPAKGTTMQKYIPKDQQPSGDNPSSDKVAAFYDLSKGEWRSVSNRSDEIVIKRDEETGKPKVVVSDKKPKEEPTKPSMPKEKDVTKRPISPKQEPIVRPSEKPEISEIPSIDKIDVETPKEEPEEVIDINDRTTPADQIDPEKIEVPEEEPKKGFDINDITFPDEEHEEEENTSQDYEKDEDVSEKKPNKEDITFPPDEDDITFPEE